jgi:ribosomal protein S12 methylthiotransferase accessory factor
VDVARARVQLLRPFDMCPQIVFARTAVRSREFGPTEASGGANVLVGSAAGTDGEDVAVRARHELIERASNILAGRAAERAGAVVGSFAQLRRQGTEALDPAAWHMLDESSREIPMLWVGGRSLIDGRDVLVPAGAAFLRHRPPPGCAAPIRAGSAGVAAHLDEALAGRHALREMLERDLIARSWFADGSASIADPQPPLPPSLDTACQTLGLELSAFALAGPRGWDCVVACLHAPPRAAQSFGARCVAGDDLATGLERAVYEALMVRWSMSTPVAHRAWDAMRARPQPPLPENALEHALWTFHEQDSLGRWLANAAPIARAPDAGKSAGLDLAAAVAEQTGGDVVAVSSSVAGIGADAVVMRVVAPGAMSLPARATRGVVPHPFG